MGGGEGGSLYLAAENRAVSSTLPVPIARQGPKCFPYVSLCEVSYGHGADGATHAVLGQGNSNHMPGGESRQIWFSKRQKNKQVATPHLSQRLRTLARNWLSSRSNHQLQESPVLKVIMEVIRLPMFSLFIFIL